MTALSAAARRTKYSMERAVELSLPMGTGVTIYANGLVCFNATGYAAAAADTANFKIAGLAAETKTNSGADGAANVRVLRGVEAEFAIQSTSITIADAGLDAVVQDDNTVTDATTATNDVRVGVITGMSGALARVIVGTFALASAP